MFNIYIFKKKNLIYNMAKKSNTINYDFYENPSQAVANNGAKYHIRINNRQVVDLDGLGRQLEQRTTAKMPDIMLVVTGLREIIKEELEQGNSVCLDGICRIEPILGVKDEGCEGREYGKSIHLKTLRAHAVKSLIQDVRGGLGHCQFKEATHSKKVSEEEVVEWLTDYFKKESTVCRRQLEEKFGLSRYMAMKILKKFVADGKLYRPGLKNDSVYMPVEGSFK